MTTPLKLYFHPLASYCWKALVALYENGTPFEPRITDLGNERDRAELQALWPLAKFPVLRDDARDRTVPEATIIIEYLAQHYPGPVALVYRDPDLAREVRLRDRFFDLYVQEPMQKIVGDRLRPAGKDDPHGVEQARAALATAYAFLERELATPASRTWAVGEAFTMADCAALPALFYANVVAPLGGAYPNVTAYLGRLSKRPSVARVLDEAKPYFAFFPARPGDLSLAEATGSR